MPITAYQKKLHLILIYFIYIGTSNIFSACLNIFPGQVCGCWSLLRWGGHAPHLHRQHRGEATPGQLGLGGPLQVAEQYNNTINSQ